MFLDDLRGTKRDVTTRRVVSKAVTLPGSVTIVGMSLAGLRCAEALRRLGYSGRITAIGAEQHEPYDRPPLSKDFLIGKSDAPALRLSKEGLGALSLDLRLGERATSLDVATRCVALDSGSTVSSDAVVIATGARPRSLPLSVAQPDLETVHQLRTIEDAARLRDALDSANGTVAVIGAGFIGMEIAAACRGLGLSVTVIDVLPQPMIRGLGESIGAACAALHRANGVAFELGIGVVNVDHGGVVLADGRRIDSEVVVVGVGASPRVEWLETSGLQLADGVVCDSTCAAAPGIYAIGDVARWPNALFDGELMRLEHWTNAVEQASHVAEQIVNDTRADFVPVPFVWSDQYDTKIQCVGRIDPTCEQVIAHGDLSESKFVAIFGNSDRIVGAIGFSQARQIMQYRRMIAERASWADALERAQS